MKTMHPSNPFKNFSKSLLAVFTLSGLGLGPLTAAEYGSSAFPLPRTIFGEGGIEGCPEYTAEDSQLSVGRDGRIFMTCVRGGSGDGLLMEVGPDGKPVGCVTGTGHVTGNAHSNHEGTTVIAAMHGAHQIKFFDKDLIEIAVDTEYSPQGRGSEGHANPAGVWAGASGRFYAYDLYERQIVVYSAQGVREDAIPLTGDSFFDDDVVVHGQIYPDEANKRFILLGRKGILTFDESGKEVSFFETQNTGPWCFSDTGKIYRLNLEMRELEELSPEGEVVSSVMLAIDDVAAEHPIDFISVQGGAVYVKRRHPSELFQKYDIENGSLLTTALATAQP